MTTKQRAYLKGLAMTIEPIFQCGKSSVTPDFVKAVPEEFISIGCIKISVLQNCADDPKEIGIMISERTRSELVQVIGKKIVLYKQAKNEKNRKIELPKAAKKQTI